MTQSLWKVAFAPLFVFLLVGVTSTSPPVSVAQQSADLVLLNGKLVTVDKNFSVKQALAIQGGKFLAVGTNDEIRRLAGPTTRTIDLKGRTVTPGLFDSHIHAIRSARTWDLGGLEDHRQDARRERLALPGPCDAGQLGAAAPPRPRRD